MLFGLWLITSETPHVLRQDEESMSPDLCRCGAYRRNRRWRRHGGLKTIVDTPMELRLTIAEHGGEEAASVEPSNREVAHNRPGEVRCYSVCGVIAVGLSV